MWRTTKWSLHLEFRLTNAIRVLPYSVEKGVSHFELHMQKQNIAHSLCRSVCAMHVFNFILFRMFILASLNTTMGLLVTQYTIIQPKVCTLAVLNTWQMLVPLNVAWTQTHAIPRAYIFFIFCLFHIHLQSDIYTHVF